MISPTKRQMAVLRFITGFQEAHGHSPSHNEIAAGTGMCQRGQGTDLRLEGLEERGWIRRLPNRARAIEVLHPPAIPRDPQGEPLYFVEVRK